MTVLSSAVLELIGRWKSIQSVYNIKEYRKTPSFKKQIIGSGTCPIETERADPVQRRNMRAVMGCRLAHQPRGQEKRKLIISFFLQKSTSDLIALRPQRTKFLNMRSRILFDGHPELRLDRVWPGHFPVMRPGCFTWRHHRGDPRWVP